MHRFKLTSLSFAILCSIAASPPAIAANGNAIAGIEAESHDAAQGVQPEGSFAVGGLDNGDYMQYSQVDFGAGVSTFEARVAVDAAYAGQIIELRLDSLGGPKIGELVLQSTGGWTQYQNQSVPIQLVAGVHDLFLIARGTYGIGNIDRFRFVSLVNRSAFSDIEAESFNASQGVQSGGGVVGYLDHGDHLRYDGVDFGTTGAQTFSAYISVDPAYAGQKIEVRLGSPTGTKVGELTLASTGGWEQPQWQSATIQQVTGVHDVFLVVNGSYGAGNLDRFKFAAGSTGTPPTGTLEDSGPLSFSGQAVVEIRNKRITGAPGHCIAISGAQTQVVIDNVDLSGCGGHGIHVVDSANVSIRNSHIHDLSHDQNRNADGIHARNVANLTIEDNRFAEIYTVNASKEDTQYQDNFAVGIRTGASSNVLVRRNEFRRVGTGLYATPQSSGVNFTHNYGENMQGPFPRGQMVQFDGVQGGGNRITCNRIDNTGPNKTEDNINVYMTQGLPNDPVLVAYNRIKGGASIWSGSGIVAGDYGGRHIRIVRNRLVDVIGVGIGVAGGEDIEVADNKIYKNLPGVRGEGLKAQNFSPSVQSCTNVRFSNNQIRWNEAGQVPNANEFYCDGPDGCSTYWSLAMNITQGNEMQCSVTDPTQGGAAVTNDAWRSNNVDATQLTPAIYDEPIPECN